MPNTAETLGGDNLNTNTNTAETLLGGAGYYQNMYAEANAECGLSWGYVKSLSEQQFLDHMRGKIRLYLLGRGFATGQAGFAGYITIDHIVEIIVQNLRRKALENAQLPVYGQTSTWGTTADGTPIRA